MGLTSLKLKISNPTAPENSQELTFLIDSGAIYTVAPKNILKSLGIKPYKSKEFILADGSSIIRELGHAWFQYGEEIGNAPVIFGEVGDKNLLGVTTLESMGLGINPLKGELISLPMRFS